MPKARDIVGIDRGQVVSFSFNGRTVHGHAGESIAAALLRAGITGTRRTASRDQPRGYYCGMGVCWECVIEVVGMGTVRSCMQPVAEGLVARTAITHGH